MTNVMKTLATLSAFLLAIDSFAIDCTQRNTWRSQQVYVGGSQVQLNGHAYTANYWTQNNNPETHSTNPWDHWRKDGSCDNQEPPPPSGDTSPVDINGQLRVCGTKLCNQFGIPIQLRGMSTHGLQWYGWGDCVTETSLDALAYDWGADVVRISLYVQEGGYETNPVFFTQQVSRIIDEVTERGMYALVDWHQLYPGDPNENLNNAVNFFTDIANAHRDKVNIIYDIANEPNGVSWDRIKVYADQMIPLIRSIDSDAPILVGTHGWSTFGLSDGRNVQDIIDNPLTYQNIMYTFHFYAASHGELWLNQLDWASNQLPVFVTEFGTQTYSGDGENNFVMSQRYLDLMSWKKISWTNWNFSDDFRSGAVFVPGTCPGGPWNDSRLKPAGLWIKQRISNPADNFPTR